MRGCIYGVVLTGCLLAATELSAQDRALRNLTGTVMDSRHEPLRGAVVEIENLKTEAVTSFLTDSSGHYDFRRLETGTDYRFFATYRGHRSRQKRLGMFDSRNDETVNLTIRLE